MEFRTPIKGYLLNHTFFELLPNGLLYVRKGYQWNGCSPKFRIKFFKLSWVLGTWDGPVKYGKPKTYFPSMVHDVLYQIKLRTRSGVDKYFYKMMRVENFLLAWPYYLVVRIFGGKAWNE